SIACAPAPALNRAGITDHTLGRADSIALPRPIFQIGIVPERVAAAETILRGAAHPRDTAHAYPPAKVCCDQRQTAAFERGQAGDRLVKFNCAYAQAALIQLYDNARAVGVSRISASRSSVSRLR